MRRIWSLVGCRPHAPGCRKRSVGPKGQGICGQAGAQFGPAVILVRERANGKCDEAGKFVAEKRPPLGTYTSPGPRREKFGGLAGLFVGTCLFGLKAYGRNSGGLTASSGSNDETAAGLFDGVVNHLTGWQAGPGLPVR